MRQALRLLLFIGVLLPIVSYGQTINMTGGNQTTQGTTTTNGAGTGTPNLSVTFTCTGAQNTDSVSITAYTGTIANAVQNGVAVGTGSASITTSTLPVGTNSVQCHDATAGTFAGYFYIVAADPTRSSVSIVDIQDPDGTPLNGTVCFTPVNMYGQIIAYSDAGGAAIRPVPACRTITNGALSTILLLPRSNLTIPVGVTYNVYFADKVTNDHENYGTYDITGDTWSLDDAAPSNVQTAPPAAWVPTITVGSVTALPAGTSPTVTDTGSQLGHIFNFGLPQGAQGPQGVAGPTGPQGVPGPATVAIGSVTTGAAGSNASVTNVGTQNAAILNFTVPQGPAGTAVAAGSAGAVQVASNVGQLTTATPANIGAAITDSQSNSVLSNALPTVWPLPSGFADNIFVGAGAGQNTGNGSGLNATSGAIYIGAGAGQSAKTDNGSVFIGLDAAQQLVGSNTSGEDTNSVCIGPSSCVGSLTMFEDVAVGNKAMLGTSTTNQTSSVFVGSHTILGGSGTNTVVGANVGWLQGNGGTTPEKGTANTLIGQGILNGITTQYPGTMTQVTALGDGACQNCYTADDVIAIGELAGGNMGNQATAITTGMHDIAIGQQSAATLVNGTDDIFMGYRSGFTAAASVSNNICIGDYSCPVVSGADTVALGEGAFTLLTGADNTGIGYAAGGSGSTTGAASQNTAVGSHAGYFVSGTDNTSIGYSAGSSTNQGAAVDNTWVGANTGNDSSSYNVGLGEGADGNGYGGSGYNVYIGYNSINYGGGPQGSNTDNVLLGANTVCYECSNSVALGAGAVANYTGTVQIGAGNNGTNNSMQFQSWNFLSSTGAARFSAITDRTQTTAGCATFSGSGVLTSTGSACATGTTASIRAGSGTISSGTTVAITFPTAMSVTPTHCSITPTSDPTAVGAFWVTGVSTTGFTLNVHTAGTLAFTYGCLVNNSN